MVDRYLTLYAPQPPRWDNISSLASTLGWADLTAQTTSEYLTANGISTKYVHEMVEASTRVNYGQVKHTHTLSPFLPNLSLNTL
jgi:prenylcysteine oxidase/farnesylcysteine lyase